MSKAIFTTSEGSAYDDQPEVRYHFPQTYLRQAKEALGDWIVYYEPRRTEGPSSSSGRQAYFAMARVRTIERDANRDDHYYAYVDGYIEFDRAVPFREGASYYESALAKADGSTNRGAFGRAVRSLPEEEFTAIVRAGFVQGVEPWEVAGVGVAEEEPAYEARSVVQQITSRKFRDRAFARHIRAIYQNTCAISGLKLVNGGGRPEVQAAHIRPVEADGPDTVRNGIALTGTVHWMFDRGLVSISDDYRILVASCGLPTNVAPLVIGAGEVRVPLQGEWRPHPTYLRWHRENRFKA